MSIWAWVFVAFVAIAMVYRLLRPRSTRWRVRKANNVLEQLRRIEHDGQVIGYLRKVDPYVFEELCLTCFERRGLIIKRNRRYSGDGGVDGEIYINRRLVLLQVKRYRHYISARHVRQFANVIDAESNQGLFIHTGKTGRASKLLFEQSNVECISGKRLVRLIRGDTLSVLGVMI